MARTKQLEDYLSNTNKRITELTSSQLRSEIPETINKSPVFEQLIAQIAQGLARGYFKEVQSAFKQAVAQKISTPALDPAAKEAVYWWNNHVNSNLSLFIKQGSREPYSRKQIEKTAIDLKNPEVVADVLVDMTTKVVIRNVLDAVNKDMEKGIKLNNLKNILLFGSSETVTLLQVTERLKQLTKLYQELEIKETADLNLTSILNKLAKQVASSPDVAAVPGPSNLNNKMSDKEIQALSKPLQAKMPTSQPAFPAASEENTSSAAVSGKNTGKIITQVERERVLKENFDELIALRKNEVISQKTENEIKNFLKETLNMMDPEN